MHRPAVSTMTTQRIDRLLRSLVGVADVRMSWRGHTLRAVHILRGAGTQNHQLIRNIVSGLQAGFGIQLVPAQVHIHDDAHVFDAIEVAADVLTGPEPDDAKAAADPPAPVNGKQANGTLSNGTHANGTRKNGNGAAKPASNGNGNGYGAAKAKAPVRDGGQSNGARNGGAARDASPRRNEPKPAAPVNGVKRPERRAPAPEPQREPLQSDMVARPSSASADVIAAAADLVARRQHDELNAGLTLERIDVERRNGMLRCRTVLALGERQYSAIAEVPDSPSAEAELAARVAVDALRAGGLTAAMLDGVGFITIGKSNYCVATVREPGGRHPRAGAAPLIDSMAASATAAVLTALGSFTDARAQNRARAGH